MTHTMTHTMMHSSRSDNRWRTAFRSLRPRARCGVQHCSHRPHHRARRHRWAVKLTVATFLLVVQIGHNRSAKAGSHFPQPSQSRQELAGHRAKRFSRATLLRTRMTSSHTIFGAPGRNRTCDLRFRNPSRTSPGSTNPYHPVPSSRHDANQRVQPVPGNPPCCGPSVTTALPRRYHDGLPGGIRVGPDSLVSASVSFTLPS